MPPPVPAGMPERALADTMQRPVAAAVNAPARTGANPLEMSDTEPTPTPDGYAVAHLDDMGDGYGFRKARRELGVTAFGINAVVLPPGYATGMHFHEHQEETYFVHQGQVEFRFGDGTAHVVRGGGMARVGPSTPRGRRHS